VRLGRVAGVCPERSCGAYRRSLCHSWHDDTANAVSHKTAGEDYLMLLGALVFAAGLVCGFLFRHYLWPKPVQPVVEVKEDKYDRYRDPISGLYTYRVTKR